MSRCRVAAVLRRTSSRWSGHTVPGLLVEASRAGRSVEAVVASSCRPGPPRRGLGPRIGVERRPHRPGALGAGATSRCRAGCPASLRPRAVAGRGSDAGRSRARISGSSRRKPRSSWSRSAIDRRGVVGRWRAWIRSVSSTSTRWRRSRRASSMQARTSRPVQPGVEAVRDRAAWADHARPGRARSGRRPWPGRDPGG